MVMPTSPVKKAVKESVQDRRTCFRDGMPIKVRFKAKASKELRTGRLYMGTVELINAIGPPR